MAVGKSDLPVRVASAVVMVAVAGTALWLGGWAWTALVVAVSAVAFWEWRYLAFAISGRFSARATWLGAGLLYMAAAGTALVLARLDGIFVVTLILISVIGVDVGAYFAGRSIGGPKIAPKISPSKTWAGLVGGAMGAGLLFSLFWWAWPAGLCRSYFDAVAPLGPYSIDDRCHLLVPTFSDLLVEGPVVGTFVAVVAQAGDFFESWMKRRAGVKDSGTLIPGHGGVLDRVDGLLSVSFVLGLMALGARTL